MVLEKLVVGSLVVIQLICSLEVTLWYVFLSRTIVILAGRVHHVYLCRCFGTCADMFEHRSFSPKCVLAVSVLN